MIYVMPAKKMACALKCEREWPANEIEKRNEK